VNDHVALHKSTSAHGLRAPQRQLARRDQHPHVRPMNAALPAALEYPVAAPPPPGETIEIAPRVHWLRMPLPFALDHINLWLLQDDDDGMPLVDCGFGAPPTRALWDRHFATVLASRPIRRIIATHCHPDHVGNAAWLSERTGAAVAMTLSEFLTAHALVADT